MEENTRNTIFVLIILLVLVVLIIRYLIRRRKQGRPVSGCGRDCANCPSAKYCKEREPNR